ncbi:MAG: alpha/beta hydrolase [Planctomycetota bacterium]|nr:MAG: alpha/beta hydrolase [Planctomycetota bacterium]
MTATIDTSPFTEEYSFESHFHDLNGLKYHYLHEGKDHSKEIGCALMVHGNPTWSFYYRNLAKSLSSSMQVVVPDHIGCGLSDKPQDYSYTVANHIQNLVELVEKLDLNNINLIVHDWGGAIGFGAAIKFPERISTITVLNTAAFLIPKIPFSINICKIPIFGAIVIRGFNGFAGPAIKMACKNQEKMTSQIKQGYLAPYNNWHNRIATLRFVQDIPMHKSHPSWDTMKSIQDKIEILKDKPMHIFWGKKDFCFNDFFLEEWQKRFPNASVKEYAEAGHYVLEDANPEIIEDITSWISNQ